MTAQVIINEEYVIYNMFIIAKKNHRKAIKQNNSGLN